VAGFSQAAIAAAPEAQVPFEVEDAFHAFARRRRAGEPVAYILGHREFYSLQLSVNPAVLIPRPETELLVDLALQRRPASVLDLGTGSGAVALAIKRHLPGATVVAIDSSATALAVARRNAVKLGLAVDFRHGRWFEPVAGERFDLVVANPPYVAEGDPHLPELRHEPVAALVSGPDGLAAIREIISAAGLFIAPGGCLLLEHGQGQDAGVRDLLEREGFGSVRTWPDLAGIGRVSGGTR